MDARSIITRLRDKERPSETELVWFAEGLASGQVSDAQAGAFAMAVLLNGFTTPERVAFTLAMRDTGDVMEWSLPGPVIDKHSTGGVGDCVSFLLAPLLAIGGAYNPMISGRGLGHTGGTLDKLEAIPGVRTEIGEAKFRQIVSDVGCAIVSASGKLAPADKRLYAVRDVTATVESLDLITASILSKKLAAGLDALVLDVKVGSGAFMATAAEAEALANSLVETANGAGCATAALISDMNQPLAPACGNALEIAVVMDVMTGGAKHTRYQKLVDLSVSLSEAVLELAGIKGSTKNLRESLSDGRAADIFARMVAALGGPKNYAETWRSSLPEAPVIRPVFPTEKSTVSAIDGRLLGDIVVHLGGGRLRQSDVIDPSVGLSETAALGVELAVSDPIAVIHAKDDADADAAERRLRQAYTLGDATDIPALVHKRIG